MATIPLLLGTALYFSINEGKEKSKKSTKETFITKYKNPNSFSKRTKNLINLVTAKNDINPVGSQKFKVHRYPGDIDLFEPVKYCCNFEDAMKFIVRDIKKIATQLKKKENTYLGDFKAGIDSRYQLSIGSISKTNKVLNYDTKIIIKELNNLEDLKLLTKKQKEEILKELPSNSRINSRLWYKFDKFYRKYYVIRWELDEIIKGKKQIGFNKGIKELTLREALTHDSIVKIDIWALVNERYIEITNFFLLAYKDKKGKETVINMEMSNYYESLIKDIKHYFEIGKYMKASKRAWALGTNILDNKLLLKLYPLYTSSIGMLYQLSAEIETLIMIFESVNVSNLPLDKIINQIDDFKMRITMIFDLDLNETKMFALIEEILNDYEKNKNRMKIKKTINNLQILMNDIDEIVENETFLFLKKEKLEKLPNYFDKLLK